MLLRLWTEFRTLHFSLQTEFRGLWWSKPHFSKPNPTRFGYAKHFKSTLHWMQSLSNGCCSFWIYFIYMIITVSLNVHVSMHKIIIRMEHTIIKTLVLIVVIFTMSKMQTCAGNANGTQVTCNHGNVLTMFYIIIQNVCFHMHL